MAFEGIVRPFQNDPVFTARVLAPALPATVDPRPAILTWSGTEEANWVEEPPYVSNMNITTEWVEDKARRVTEVVRVENPDDPTQFVEVERMKRTTMTDAQTGKEFTMRFADWDKGRKG